MRIAFISDTHTYHNEINFFDNDIDILCHTGDITFKGELNELRNFDKWVGTLNVKKTIVIAGNHDLTFQHDPIKARACLQNCEYLEDSEFIFRGIKFYGSPWQPEFHSWAFNLPRGKDLEEVWAKIPDNTDILLTHGPPWEILDLVRSRLSQGCKDLKDRLSIIKPAIHAFGHIHEGYGIKASEDTLYINASICNLCYKAHNKPIIIDIDEDTKQVSIVDGGGSIYGK